MMNHHSLHPNKWQVKPTQNHHPADQEVAHPQGEGEKEGEEEEEEEGGSEAEGGKETVDQKVKVV